MMSREGFAKEMKRVGLEPVTEASVILGPQGRPLEPQAPPRSCGSCSACCGVLGVPGVPNVKDGRKEPHTRCPNQAPGGCSVYADRPTACRTYRCAWLEGQWDEGDRPDRSGVIADAAEGAVVFREVFRGAFNRNRVKTRMLELHRLGLHVRLIPYKGRKLPTGKAL
jgi:hypothetical protein